MDGGLPFRSLGFLACWFCMMSAASDGSPITSLRISLSDSVTMEGWEPVSVQEVLGETQVDPEFLWNYSSRKYSGKLQMRTHNSVHFLKIWLLNFAAVYHNNIFDLKNDCHH